MQLEDEYQIVWRPHPMFSINPWVKIVNRVRSWFPKLVIHRFAEDNQMVHPMWVLQDVSLLVSEVSAILTMAMSLDIDVVALYQTKNHANYKKLYDNTINDKLAITLFPDTFDYDFNAVRARLPALRNEEVAKQRRRYCRYMFGPIDGLEEYRNLITIMKKASITSEWDLLHLEVMLRRIEQTSSAIDQRAAAPPIAIENT